MIGWFLFEGFGDSGERSVSVCFILIYRAVPQMDVRLFEQREFVDQLSGFRIEFDQIAGIKTVGVVLIKM